MATQYSNEIPFSANHTQQAFKLLELPPELLALLESDTPPTINITASSTPPQHAHLSVSNGKTYILRQKNTSNPLMLLMPSTTQPTSSSSEEEEDALSSFIPQPSITRISSVADTIELIEKEDDNDVKKDHKPVKVNKWHEKFAKSREGRGPGSKN
ncbi:hypothetical protein NHQ30_004826 [Ciborinia camelliae]|nr:hypothetical protein NHQ30_004826 [Ciborinia camelliae]